MADRNIGENAKAVRNPLLSGAGANFPIESFTNLTLVAPVDEPIQPQLIQDVAQVDTFVGEADTFVGQDPVPLIQQQQEAGYTGLFRSFFGKSEIEGQQKIVDNQSSLDSTPRSYSPFVHVPNVISYSPGLIVPEEKEPENQQPTITFQQQVNVTDDRKEAANFFEETTGSTCSSNDSIVADLQIHHKKIPTFFQPPVEEINIQSAVNFPSYPATSVSSKYRLGNQRRPVYAPVPGLSTGPSQNIFKPANNTPSSTASFFTPIPVEPFPASENIWPPTIAMTNTDTLNTVDLQPQRRSPSPSVIPQRLNQMGQSGIIYRPPYYHWFWNKEEDDKENWIPFSMTDSLELEEAYNSPTLSEETIVATDGGRFDVNILARKREAVFWKERPSVVRRCSWFQRRSTEARPRPYDENTSLRLEEEYKTCVTTATWNRHVQITDGEYVLLYGPSAMAHFFKDDWDPSDVLPDSQKRGCVVKRGVDDFEIDDGESPIVDHIVFIVHGIGPICDLKFRSIEEAVNDFRQKAQQLIKTHYRTSVDHGQVNRIEMIPVSWHQNLHGESGVDEKMKKITLKSIPKLRDFTNDTLLDILFYTSPIFCQSIMQQVGDQLNQLYGLFMKRNPSFRGHVSLCGHSLGSLILFDLLCHQKRDHDSFSMSDNGSRLLQRTGSYVASGATGAGQPLVTYPQLNFQPNTLFALGSPIGMFVTVRGIDSLGLDFRLPTCPGFYNLFHPFDPVAYRIEALINPQLCDLRPVLIPHHKGRKRMHLELREQMARVGADIKQRLIDSVKSTWNTVYQLAMFGGRADEAFQQEVDHAIASHLEAQARTESVCEDESTTNLNLGVINQGRRIDYVLQEAPLESFNEYVSAITSHVCYWDSEDTILFILKDIYTNLGIAADNPAAVNDDLAASTLDNSSSPSVTDFNAPINIDPTLAINISTPIQPPPIQGFVRK